jgi:multiple sugar transport system substrate-binding protein
MDEGITMKLLSRYRRHLIAALLAATLLAACGEPPQQAPAKPFAGQTIMLIVPKLHADLIRGPILDEVGPFEEQTGATVRVVTPGWNETIEKIDQSLSDPALNYDIFVVLPLWKGTFLHGNHIAPVPEWVKRRIDWEDVLPIYRNHVLTWDNTAYGLPYDGDCINLYYRRDLFANADYRRRFEAEYGYPLAPPRTWEQYRDIATFFNGWDWDGDGNTEYGHAGLRLKGDVTLLQFFARAAAYAKHPDHPGYYFDPQDMTPRINNPGFVRALEEYVANIAIGPPGMASYAGHDVRNAFAAGEVAMAIDWADLGIYSVNSPVSVIHDKVGYAQIPGSERVYNPQSGEWEVRFNQPSSISGSWMFLVNRDSKYQELAFTFAAHMTSPKLTRRLTATAGNAVNPSRFSHFDNAEAWEAGGFTTDSARRYLDTITESLQNPNVVTDITIPGAGRYYRALDDAIGRAVQGELTAQQALDLAAEEWQAITDRLGRAEQARFYRQTLNLPAD